MWAIYAPAAALLASFNPILYKRMLADTFGRAFAAYSGVFTPAPDAGAGVAAATLWGWWVDGRAPLIAGIGSARGFHSSERPLSCGGGAGSAGVMRGRVIVHRLVTFARVNVDGDLRQRRQFVK